MKPSEVIKLDDNRQYLLVEDYEYDNKKYFLAVGVLSDGNVSEDDYKFFTESVEDGDTYVEEVEDKELLKTLTYLVSIDVGLDEDTDGIDKLDKFIENYKNEGSA